MGTKLIIKGGIIINEGKKYSADILIEKGRIKKIAQTIDNVKAYILDARGLFIIPGLIDDQVHFRDPGVTYKADIASESAAAVAGGVTSYMEMPNTKPSTLTQELLESKYQTAKRSSYANYSFYMGASNDNIEEVLKTNPKNVCGVKVFMGSSTGNMLVDDEQTLDNLFSKVPLLIATHCEDEETIKSNYTKYYTIYGDKLDASFHPKIRDHKACLLSSSKAVAIAKKHGTRLHVLHLTTAQEMDLFNNDIPLKDKKITSEVCVHHLRFDENDYKEYGNKIICNPAIKTLQDKNALFDSLLNDKIDVIATDHAPHTWEEKSNHYLKAPSGVPLVQHSLNIMLEFYNAGKITLEKIVEKMCHAPAICFKVLERGFIREGYKADLCIFDPNGITSVNKSNILYKCNWSPFEGHNLPGKIEYTLVNGVMVYSKGQLLNQSAGERLEFDMD